MAKTQSKPENGETTTFSLISNEKLLAIYTAMLKCRLLEQRATTLFQHGKLNSDLHPSAGLEATAAAVAIDLQHDDTISIVPGDWLPAFVKGMSPDTLFRVLAPAVAEHTETAAIEAAHKNILFASTESDLAEVVRERASAALTSKNGAVVAAFIRPGKQPLIQWRKTLQIAASKKLPIIFAHYIHEPGERASAARSKKSDALLDGLPSIAVDAYDPVAVYRVAYEATVRARQLRGATLLQCIIHDQSAVSSPKESNSPPVEKAITDPVSTMETYLKSKGINPEAHSRQIVATFNRDLDLATRFFDA
jgi:TPP-dependent pyruvate/acetoin dehydrogenase alpha subunit